MNAPIVICKCDKRNFYFYCEFCKRKHIHGLGKGHRVAHCFVDSEFYQHGYVLKVDPECCAKCKIKDCEERSREVVA
jgi:hypothetical protein